VTDDPMTMACLLVLRQLGGRKVPAKQDIFTKGLKKPLADAIANGLVEAAKTEVQSIGANGKAKKSKVDVLSLTPAGEAKLHAAADPQALAATSQAALQKSLEEDRASLRNEVLAALGNGSAKAKADPKKDLAAISKSLGDLAKRVESLESQLQSEGSDAILQRIDQGFAALRERLGAAPVPSRPAPPAAAPPQTSHSSAAAAEKVELGQVLKDAYEDLCLLVEFEDRLIPLPRLYHQAKFSMPSLTVAAFHQKLQQLWDERVLELQGINEVRTAAEPDKAIQRGDRLLYFVIWR